MPVTVDSSIEQLRATITSAFAAAPHPGDAALVTGDTSYDPEYRAVAHAFSGKHWCELSRAFIREHRDALPLLGSAAFRFFLPAYLLACLEDETDLDTAPLNVVSSLSPPEPGNTSARAFSERAEAFTVAEARAIAAYLQLARDREPEGSIKTAATRALGYWRSARST
jgi:hypothetical protein